MSDKALVPIGKLPHDKAQAAAQDIYDRKAEITIVGYAMSNPETLHGPWMSQVKSSCFHDEDTRATWDAIRQIVDEDGVPLPFVVNDKLQGVEYAPSGLDMLAWADVEGLTGVAEYYAKQLVTMAEQRRAQLKLGEIVKMLHDPKARSMEPGHTTLAIRSALDGLPIRVMESDEYDTEQLDALDDSGETWLVPGVMVDEGVNLLFGEAGAGKSMLMLDLSLKVLAGGSALGNQITREGAVVYLGADVSRKTMKKRWNKIRKAAGYPDTKGWKYIRAVMDFGSGEAFTFIQHKMDEAAIRHPSGKCALLVVDHWTSYMAALDQNSEADTGRVMNHLRLLSERTGACIVIIHHANKNAFAEGSNRARGTTALPAAVDVVVQVQKKGGVLIVTQTKNREGEFMHPLECQLLDTEDGGLAVVYSEAKPQDVGAIMIGMAQDAMLGVLMGCPNEAVTKQNLYLAVEAKGNFSSATLQRAWDGLKRMPGVSLGTLGRQATVLYQPTSQPLTT